MDMDKMKKRLILVGNKPVYRTGLHMIVDSFDYVLRVSRMNNLGDTGYRIDGIYLEANNIYKTVFEGGENKNEIQKASNIFMHRYWYEQFQEWELYLTRQQYDTVEIIDHEAAIQDIGFERPTSTVLMLAYLLNSSWNDRYHIHITGIDVANRAELIDGNPLWSYHNGAGIYEEKYLKNLIRNGVITRIEDE